MGLHQYLKPPYIARHLGAPNTDSHVQVRETTAHIVAQNEKRGVIRTRAKHAAYGETYRPIPVDNRRPVERPQLVEAAA